jgi:hypothetical protein
MEMNEEFFKQTKEYFDDHGYVIIREFLKSDMTKLAYEYAKMVVRRQDTKYWFALNIYDKIWDGAWGDSQIYDSYCCYSDPLMESILSLSTPMVSAYTGKNLFPTYSYWRFYQKGDELKRHRDRESCEVSATVCLGYDVSNVDKTKHSDYNWPMWVQSAKTGEEHPGGLNPGDIILYKGCEIDHWREPFIGMNHAQVFLHYNDKNGPYKNLYDGRPFMGVPNLNVFKQGD